MIVFFCSFVQAERQSLVAENLKNVDMCRRRDLEDLQVQEVRYLAVEYALFPRRIYTYMYIYICIPIQALINKASPAYALRTKLCLNTTRILLPPPRITSSANGAAQRP